MGVPKFFRYISERYPCLSEIVREYQLPEFDNMYLDMNGIIHMCSHPDDNNPHFRITEEKIFQDIFHYLEVLFRMIRPQKLFFMAIDGVAPRAKMNQQRGRRFRSAKDAEKQEAEAKKRGETLPTEARFDSNCITPGTVFMARLHEQLKYFVTDKISNDPLWRSVKVILSGHETPGEGEHKIMDYIRYIRSQPGYDPNTRHCLYGLDADLIMLGLCSHEPHFSLLREEVKFGKKSTKRQSVPEEITFFLLHLSLMREYLELEFIPVKDKLVSFEYDFEKIIDDWVLMGFLVGNDFIPHLPNLHIANGALPILYKAYMEVLPTLDGYINEAGTLNLVRFEKFMQKLGNIDLENFEEIRDDLLYMETKTGRKLNAHSEVSSGRDMKVWIPDDLVPQYLDNDDDEILQPLEPEKYTPRDAGLAALIKETSDLGLESDEEEKDEEESAFENFKKDYYKNKLEYSQVTPGVMRDQAEGYVRAIQWNLNYYYNGVCSWSWFYPHHYAPYISDIKGFSDFKIDFELGTPFKPYEQLLGVLPAASKNLLPKVYHQLMTGEDSPIKKYYPEDFQTDLNGKKQEWEAVVLIPFMDENELLEAMKPCWEHLTEEERRRNTHGPMLVYTYTEEDFGKYDAPAYFPSVKHNHCKLEPIQIQNIVVPREKLVKGAYPGVSMDVYYPGFPTMKHLKYEAELRKAKVKVFEQPSRYENMIIRIIPDEELSGEDVPAKLMGTNVFVAWPHLIEGRIVAMSNAKEKFVSMGGPSQYNVVENDKTLFRDEYSGVVERYRNRLGIEVGDVKVLCHVQVMIGRKYVFSPNGRLTLEKQFSENTAYYPLQTVVTDINAHDAHHSAYRNITDVFPEGASCFTLCNPYYGSQGLVLDSKESLKSGRIKVCVSVTDEPDFEGIKALKDEFIRSYKTLFNSASQLGMSHILYSRITGSIYVSIPDGEGGLKNVNVGLDLKFNKKNKETPGYTRKIATTWYYTSKCAELVREYSEKFPEIFQYFSENANNDNIAGDAIFGDKWEEKIKELQTWLRTLPTYSMERQPCGSQVTEPEIVQEIEKIVDGFPTMTSSKKVTMQIKPAFLYKPEIQSGTLVPDPKMNVHIFDRIVNTRKGFSVPFGLKGTITAITEAPSKNDRDTMYDVVFDKPFKDGIQMNCSSGRGYRLPKTSFINISYGKRLLEEKTGKPGSLVAMAESAQKPQSRWQNTNGQKFFNQFMQNNAPAKQNQRQYETAPHQNQQYQNPPQYIVPQYNQPQFIPHGSAFASFNTQSRGYYNNPIQSPGFPPENIDPSPAIQHYMDPKPVKKEKKEKQKEEPSGSQDVFMPKFISSPEKKKTEPVQKKEVLAERPVLLQNNRIDRPTVNTDYLKSLLKIGSPTKTKPTKSENKLSPPTLLQKDNKETSSNVSFEMLAQQVANSPASVKLLTYYQSNGLGIPRYQYFQTEGKYKAQITLTNGKLVMGEPAKNKELATENVASEVLQLLIKTTKTSGILSTKSNEALPVPPKTWVEPVREKSVDRDSDQALKTALHNPFVPTQVIKRQTSRTNNSSAQENGSGKNAVHMTDLSQESKDANVKSLKNDENKKVNSENADSQNIKKQRKPRIAANFGSKK